MAEDYTLDSPVTKPAESLLKYKIISLLFDLEGKPFGQTVAGLVSIRLKDNLNAYSTHYYYGQQAIDFIKFCNTANFSVNSMQKRALQKLEADGKIPPGSVTGTPDA